MTAAERGDLIDDRIERPETEPMRRWAAIQERFGQTGDVSAADVAYLLQVVEGAREVQQLSPKADDWWDAVLDLNRLLDEEEGAVDAPRAL
ncbi:MAG TPA: hypothetical protein VIA06_10335 [Candidatus Dormibacteraeota bacterium]|jgi:hypothetical protein|nr:hypothetical protein [Candidatus Dormibacteraeota bacterium]